MNTGPEDTGTGSPESVQQAIQRLKDLAHSPEAGPGNDTVLVSQVSANMVLVAVGDDSTAVTFDPGLRQFETSTPTPMQWQTLRKGDDFAGGWTHHMEATASPTTIIAGGGVRGSADLIKEPATGKWEVAPHSPLTEFLYRNLVLHGWHQHMENNPRKAFRRILIAIPVFIVSVFAIMALIGLAVFIWG